ncbi:class I SAM-dependent methyltransferase [Azospirillum rugosum]|uniref:Methyltransferase domain-containing protein n=1 Tax=Azospirillum rugosum TaxID=416170 RepID=A0ABS4SNE0_9PROT|nr:class I SAM-dependent methyltransferase [Azospirillum rugosum]MBP2292885.1 hypothetical protein [Azospirillum rugosum]MDQ0529363.1 hypothetical protein [Azospirillum rugosum]
MPISTILGKSVTALAINRFNARHAVSHVLDIGPGVGTYARLLRPILPKARFTAVEVWAPYVKEYGLEAVYDEVHVADARRFDYGALPRGGIALLGDVIEHMTRDEAQQLVMKILLVCDAVYIAIPIGEWPQGEYEGNPWEAHIGSYSTEDMHRVFPFVGCEMMFKTRGDDGTGLFVLARREDIRAQACQAFLEAANVVQANEGLVNCGLPGLPQFNDPSVVETFHAAVSPHLVP